MRFSSTPESTDDGEITILAIIETSLAVALALLFIKLFNSAAPIVFGAITAPFLLLRTDASASVAAAIFDSGFSKLTRAASFVEKFYIHLPDTKVAGLRSLTFSFVWLPLCCLLAAASRISATVLSLVESPRETLLAIPKNWVRIALATDCRHAPELLPEAETAADLPESAQTLKFTALAAEMTARRVRPLVQKFTLAGVFACAILYRLFLKSTSIIYFPLIWVSDVPLTAKGILTYPLERVRRWYALAVLVVMLSPLVISFNAQERLATARDRAVYTYVWPVNKSDWWHVSRVLAVGVTIAVYFYARHLAIEEPDPQREREIIARANRIRAACALFTLACFLLIILTL